MKKPTRPRFDRLRISFRHALAAILVLAAVLPGYAAAVTIMDNTLVIRNTTIDPPPPPRCRVHETTLRRGGTLSAALSHMNVSQAQTLSWNRRLAKGFRARDLHPGDHVIVCLEGYASHPRLVGLEIARRDGRRNAVGHFPRPTHAKPALAAAFTPPKVNHAGARRVTFKLNGPLHDALEQHQLSPAEINAIHAWLHADAALPAKLPGGTRVALLLGQQPPDSNERVLRLRIWYRGHLQELFSYVDKTGAHWVLNRRGQGILHVPLDQPVDYTRISSGWGWRENPVLHIPEFHKGIDFAAPMGTPVHAAASGVIKFRGWHGNYGRLVIVQHTSMMQTRYGHLSRLAAGIHVGSRVQAGQVIGYVGSTGLSTGPHLYFELFLHHLRVDPLTTKINIPVRLAGPILSAFHHYVARIEDLKPVTAAEG